MDVIKTADWILDVGPEGGAYGGELVAKGVPELIATQETPTDTLSRHASKYPRKSQTRLRKRG